MTLLVLAAGMGSRYGGLKQMEPMGPSGETLLDYSVYDAVRAGFHQIVFVIRRDFEAAFRREIAARFDSVAQVAFAYQALEDIPPPFAPPAGRSKPWGTAHALLCARDLIDEPFAVINADDFYGLSAYQLMRAFLAETPDFDSDGRALYGMAGYRLDRTLSDFGAVARGLCEVDARGDLISVTELTGIRRDAAGPYCTARDGSRRCFTGQEIVSMNFWALRPSVFPLLERLFHTFLESSGSEQTSEFYIPTAIDALIRQNRARVHVTPADEAWFGVTYPEDRPLVRGCLRRLVETGAYPSNLWASAPSPSARF